MNEGIFQKVLKPFGLYRVKSDYVKTESERLKQIGHTLDVTSRAADYGKSVMGAVEAENYEKAVSQALKFVAVDEESVRLKEAQVRLKGGEQLKRVVAAVRSPELEIELCTSLLKVVQESASIVDQIIDDIDVVDASLNRKVFELESAAEEWSIGEKMGTPNALRGVLKRASETRERAAGVHSKLSVLLEKLGDRLDDVD